MVEDAGEESLAEVDSFGSAVGSSEAAADSPAEADDAAEAVGKTVDLVGSLAAAGSRVAVVGMLAVLEDAGSLEVAGTVPEAESQAAGGPAEDLVEGSPVAGLVGNSVGNWVEAGSYQAVEQAVLVEAAGSLEVEHNE